MCRIFSRGRANHTKAVPTIGAGGFLFFGRRCGNGGRHCFQGIFRHTATDKFLSKKRKKPELFESCLIIAIFAI